jgi:hypothetical protein
MTHGAGDSRGLNLQTADRSAKHLIETGFRNTTWSCPRQQPALAFTVGLRDAERDIAQYSDAALLRTHVARRQIRRCRLHLQNYVQGTLAQRPASAREHNASRTRACMKILRDEPSCPRRSTLCRTAALHAVVGRQDLHS